MAERSKKLKKALGSHEYDMPDLPNKISNVRIAMVKHTEDRGGCSRCFPHGYETTNAAKKNKRRNWKNYRKYQWKDKLGST